MSAPSSGSMTVASTATHLVAGRRAGSRRRRAACAKRPTDPSGIFYRSWPCNLTSWRASTRHPTGCPSRDVLQGPRRQHPLRHLPRAGPLAAARWSPPRSPRCSACTPTPCARTSIACARSACSTSPPTPAARSAARSTATRWPPDAPSLGLEPPTMPMLARMVLAMAQRLGASPTTPSAVGEAEGAARAARYADVALGARGAGRRPRPTRLRPGRGRADDARRRPTRPSSRSPTARSPTSPPTHPDLVCGLHRGLVAGFVAADGRCRGHGRVLPARPPHAVPGVDRPVDAAAREHRTADSTGRG